MSTDCAEAEAALERIRAAGRRRSAEFYARNRDAHNKKRAEKRRLLRGAAAAAEPEPEPEPEPAQKAGRGRKKAWTMEEVTAALAAREGVSDSTKRTVRDAWRRVAKLADMSSAARWKADMKGLVAALKASTAPAGTRRNNAAAALVVYDQVMGSSARVLAPLRTHYAELQLEAQRETAARGAQTLEIETDAYLEQLEATFQPGDRFRALGRLYTEVPLRDDFGRLRIQVKQKAPADESTSSIYVPAKGSAVIRIPRYKTSGRYGVVREKLSAQLTSDIRALMAEDGLGEGDYLFGPSAKLSSYIRAQHRAKMGLQGGIALFRQMATPDASATIEEAVAAAQRKKHSAQTASTSYARAR